MGKETLQVDAADLESWAREKGIAPEALAELREKIDAKEVDRKRAGFWKRIAQVLGFTALMGAGVYAVHEVVEAMPETAAVVAKRELGERGELLKAKAEDVKDSAGVLIEKVEAFMKAIPSAATNRSSLEAGAMAMLRGISSDIEDFAAGNGVAPDKTMHTMNEFLSSDPALAPYWTGVTAAYEDLKKKAEDLAAMKGTFDITETDKKEAWEDYKHVLWSDIKEDFGLKSKKLSTSDRAPESPK